MSRPIVRTVGALALAAALATSSTAAFAAAPSGNPAFYGTTKRVTTLAGLNPALRSRAVQQARSLTGRTGTSQSGESDLELDLICGGDWFITWEEDADGNPILGSFNLHCAGDSIRIG